MLHTLLSLTAKYLQDAYATSPQQELNMYDHQNQCKQRAGCVVNITSTKIHL